ncbi:MAG: glycosyl hydrolase [Flavobacteriales bacterium]
MKRGFILLIMLLGLVSIQAQRPPNNVLIFDGYGLGYQPCEPSIAVSPYDPKWIVAGSILDNVHVSKDGGWTWKSEKLDSKYGVFGDPCLVASPKKDFYYLHLSNPDGQAWSSDALLDRIVIQRTKKPGKRWNAGAGVGLNGKKDQDKEWAAVSVDGSTLVTCWTQFDLYGSPETSDSTVILCSTSNRKAKAWSDPIRINRIAGDCLDGDATVEGAVPDIAADGTIYVAWAQADTIWMDRSPDGGKTWLDQDMRVATIAGGWDQTIRGVGRANGMPVTRVDRSDGAHAGRIYVNWTDNRNGEDDNDVWLVYSDDQGLTWTDPIRVNDDPPGAQQFFTWMDVDDVTGHVHIVFYDRRAAAAKYEDPRMRPSWNTEVYVASSYDGGDTWANLKVSETYFRPDPKLFFGDYNNISAYDGIVRPIWTRNDDGVLSIWTAILDGFVH